MKFLLPLRHGLVAAWKHPGLVLLVYLATLLPTLLLALVAYGELSVLNDSLFAAEALSGNRFGVWADLARAHPGDMAPVTRALRLCLPLLVVVQILVAAGVVESLLERERKREHPFLLGIGRHGWRFVRAAVWFGLVAVGLAVLVGVGFDQVNDLAVEMGDGRVQIYGWGALLLLALILFVPFDLAYDLSRVAAAAHDEGSTFLGFFRALGHVVRHPLILGPLWLFFALLTVGWHLAYVAFRASWGPGNLGQILALLAAQQLVFLLAAFFRVGLWGAEIAYHQAMGEPRWCRKRRKKTRKRKKQKAAEGEAAGGGGEATDGDSKGWSGQLTGGPSRP